MCFYVIILSTKREYLMKMSICKITFLLMLQITKSLTVNSKNGKDTISFE